MAYELREGQITIFRERSKKGDKYPDLRGTMMYEGREIKFVLWEKHSDKAGQWFSGKVDDGARRERVEYDRDQTILRPPQDEKDIPF